MAFNQTGNVTVSAQEYWHGNSLNVPGAGEQEMLLRSDQNRLSPQDGSRYDVVTKAGWQIRCLPTLSALGKYAGEGFVAVSPQGVTYQFDWMVQRTYAPYKGGKMAMVAPSPSPATGDGKTPLVNSSQTFFPRDEVRIFATQVRDPHGNKVDYVFDPQKPWRLLEIRASDGRQLTLTYDGDSDRVKSVTAGRRTWQYAYTSDAWPLLSQVTLPDGSRWKFSGDSLQASVSTATPPPSCESRMSGRTWLGAGTKLMEHPSGLLGRFELQPTEHGRAEVLGCASGRPRAGDPPMYMEVLSLVKKTLSGPGLSSPRVWRYDYGTAEGSNTVCTGYCRGTKVVTITNPANEQTRLTYGTRWSVDEGLLYREQQGWDGSKALRTVEYRYRAADAGPYPARLSYGPYSVRGDGGMALKHQPLDKKTITQQGKTFTWEATAFDEWARPKTVVRSGPSGQRNEITTYEDKMALWVTGLVTGLNVDGKASLAQEYDAQGLLTKTYKFGELQSWQGYRADGTLAWREDGAGHRTTYDDYMRGLPRSIGYADGSGESAEVDDFGLIRRLTDAVGYSTSYDYDDAGRLSSITPPAGWTVTQQRFEPVGSAEFGLDAGHWRQTITKGNAITQTYFDALWRPVLTRTFDSSQEASTRKVTVRGYDENGRPAFESYPQREDLPVSARSPGRRMSYDALGRLVRSEVDSEQGVLSSYTSYLDGFQTRLTNARGKASTQSFWALDTPDAAMLAGLDALEGVSVRIERDAFGKPTAISRGGVTRRYVYDAGQRLCKTIEPEVKATIQAYDLAGNVAWRAPGQGLTRTDTCDLADVTDGAKIKYGYDQRNRLRRTSYGDGSPEVLFSYWPDGKTMQIESAGTSWRYAYNSLRLLSTETLTFEGKVYGVAWSYNPNGDLAGLTYPSGGPGIDYVPNALGEPQRVSSFASELRYHPNGMVTGYRLGNGIQHTLDLNERGLPKAMLDEGVQNDEYTYDANGNVTAIVDKQEGVFNRNMVYDDLDRLKSASAPKVWGTASYNYDAADNLRTANVGSRSVTLNYTDGTNRLNSVTVNGTTIDYSYDPYGNINGKGRQGYTFNLGNRMTASTMGGRYVYDGLGRRVQMTDNDGKARVTVYSQAGQLLWSTQPVAGGAPTQPVYSCDAGYKLNVNTCVGELQSKPAAVTTVCPNGETLRLGQCVAVKPAVAEVYCDTGVLNKGMCDVAVVLDYAAEKRAVCKTPGYTLRPDGKCGKDVPDDYAATPVQSCDNSTLPVDGLCTVTGKEDAKWGTGCLLGTLKAWPPTPSQQACVPSETVEARGPTPAAAACQALGSPSGATLLGVQMAPSAAVAPQREAQPEPMAAPATPWYCGFVPVQRYLCSRGTLIEGNRCEYQEKVKAKTSYTCPNGGTLEGTMCRRTRTEFQEAVQERYCPKGGTLEGTICRLNNTEHVPPQTRRVCDAGYTPDGSSCYQPTGSTPTAQYGCDSGWTVLNGQCTYKAPDKAATVKYVCGDGSAPPVGGACAAGVQSTAYVYLGGKLIAETVVGGSTQYVHTDALGSPVARTGPTKNVISRTRYEPYGYVAQGQKPSAGTSQIGFTGHVQDGETELVYMQQRYYDPIAGRFLSVDPIVTETNTGKGFGRYVYAANNPFKFFDPSGGLETLAVKLVLKVNDAWTVAQKAAAATKAAHLDSLAKAGKLEKTKVEAGPSASKIFKGEKSPGQDIDHMHDVQLGGARTAQSNLGPLDSSVNRSFGAQIMQQLKNLPYGTVVTAVTLLASQAAEAAQNATPEDVLNFAYEISIIPDAISAFEIKSAGGCNESKTLCDTMRLKYKPSPASNKEN